MYAAACIVAAAIKSTNRAVSVLRSIGLPLYRNAAPRMKFEPAATCSSRFLISHALKKCGDYNRCDQ
jgi:hypothetical protein